MMSVVLICGLCQRTLESSPRAGHVKIGTVCAQCSRELAAELAPNGIGYQRRGKTIAGNIPIRFDGLSAFGLENADKC